MRRSLYYKSTLVLGICVALFDIVYAILTAVKFHGFAGGDTLFSATEFSAFTTVGILVNAICLVWLGLYFVLRKD